MKVGDAGGEQKRLVHRRGRNFRRVQLEIFGNNPAGPDHSQPYCLRARLLQEIDQGLQIEAIDARAVHRNDLVAGAQSGAARG